MEAATANIFHLSLTFFFMVLLTLGTSAAGVASDTLSNGRNLTDGNTLVSAGGSFTLGFFSLGLPSRRYLAIWFSESADAVWVANRDSPLNDTAGVLVNNGAGGLVLLDGSGRAAWSSNTTGKSSSATAAQLLESGNLVVRERDQLNTGVFIWQSFDHPSNTLIAGMRLGNNRQTGDAWFLSSWRAHDDPATGDCRRVLDTRGLPDCVTWCGGAKKYRTGPWNGQWFSGVPEMASYESIFSSQVVVTPDEIAYVFTAAAAAGSPFSRLVLDEAGVTERLVWDPSSKVWIPYMKAPRGVCDDYAKCGAFGLCNEDTASTLFCSCMAGFSPVSPSRWSMRDTSGGCRRNAPLECGNGSTTDGFVTVRGVKLPDTDNAMVDTGATLDECRARCLANCSCVAYAAADISGRGCVMWIGDMVDVRYVDKGQDLHVRLAKSELVNNKKRTVVKIMLPLTAACLLLLMSIFLVWLYKCRVLSGKRHQNKVVQKRGILGYLSASNELGDENLELPFVSFGEIAAATNNFSDDNMLGQGGFGKVYKGMLDDGKEVAIKRLSKGSGQGAEEFRNEVVLIAKLQHRNLVRLLDHANKYVLDWPTRFKIIKGVARGLLYLHQDSRLTVIHRDLKPSNILLDVDMSPKISDFGMARIFGGNQHEANTNRVVGTYGYMSPEYAMDGAFSVKSDTYSFGVILLEIVSCLKISLPRLTDFPNLLAYAWNLWKNDRAMDLMDSSISKSCSPTEVLLCIQIGLLCVQDNPNNRPLMSSVVSMLENETTTLSAPIQPVYFAHRAFEGRQTGENSISLLEGRTKLGLPPIGGKPLPCLLDFVPTNLGMLGGNKEVAIKRLSKHSGQGVEEFRNEVVLIAKLQHKNLVRLLGCCIHGEEKLLIYEYLPNKSLDYFLFGIFSVKSDTYSFGVLVLELISGSKISSPHLIMGFQNLIACAWSLWKNGKAEDLVDSIILQIYSLNEFLLCIHVGLLCVQEDPNARPLMSSVVAMLENEATTLPTPKQPAYFVPRNCIAGGAREDANKSVNSISLTTLQGR
uniref:non-specific serine/threonine protein kinase n=1 Tax=Oryza glaberrima TaxID=4538 RepID=I1PPM2_ORYGL